MFLAANAPLVLDFFDNLLVFVADNHLELHGVHARPNEASLVILEVPVHKDLLVGFKAVTTELRAFARHRNNGVVHVLAQVIEVVHDERDVHIFRLQGIKHGRVVRTVRRNLGAVKKLRHKAFAQLHQLSKRPFFFHVFLGGRARHVAQVHRAYGLQRVALAVRIFPRSVVIDIEGTHLSGFDQVVQETSDNDRLRVFASDIAVVILDCILKTLVNHNGVTRHDRSVASVKDKLCSKAIWRPVYSRRVQFDCFFAMNVREEILTLQVLRANRFRESDFKRIGLLAITERCACHDRRHLVNQRSDVFVHEGFAKDPVVGIDSCLRQVLRDARDAGSKFRRREHVPNNTGRILRVDFHVFRLSLQLDHHSAIAIPRERHVQGFVHVILCQLLVEHGHNLVENAIAIGIPVFHILDHRESVNHLDRNFAFVFVRGDVRQIREGCPRIERHAILVTTLQLEVLANQNHDILGRHVDLLDLVHIEAVAFSALLDHDQHFGHTDVHREQVNVILQEQRVKTVYVANSVGVLNDIATHFHNRGLAHIGCAIASLVAIGHQGLGILREFSDRRKHEARDIHQNAVAGRIELRIHAIKRILTKHKLHSI